MTMPVGDPRRMVLRSSRLEAVFGSTLDAVQASGIQSLVISRVQEAFDLDFKKTLYGNSPAERRDLAGDVAALANTAGGAIVLGIEEDKQSCAVAAPGVALAGAEEQRMRMIVASLVAPMPQFDVLPIPDGTSPGGTHGYMILAVPRSPSAPHAVLVDEKLRYPKRNGSTTRYLSEPEVAAAYRDRFAGEQHQVDRAHEIETDAASRLDTGDTTWVVITLVPDVAGGMSINGKAYQAFKTEMIGTKPAIVDVGVEINRTRVLRRRLLADGNMNASLYARWISIDLRTDGSGAYALPVIVLSQQTVEPKTKLINDESIAFGILSGLAFLSSHARDRAMAGGNALVRAKLAPDATMEIGHRRSTSIESRSAHPLSMGPTPAEALVPLDEIAASGPALVATAAVLLDELGQAFGIPEMGQLTQAGQIRRRYWNPSWQREIVEWAAQHGIEIIDDPLS